MKFLKGKYIVGAMAMLTMMMVAGSAFASTGFAGIGENIGTQTTGMADGTMKLAFWIGLILVIAAVATFATMSKTNVQAKVPAMMLAGGIILVSLSAFVQSGSETVWGQDESGAVQGHLGLDQY